MHVGCEAKAWCRVAWTLLICSSPWRSEAESKEDLEVYFGAGCFWHVQKAINQAEEDLLGRSEANITGITGYAGGTDNSGDICYTSYGSKGHTEVVALRVPLNRLADVTRVVWSSLFVDGERSDDVNRGAEYRAAVGFPGGVAGSPDVLEIIDAAQGERRMAVLEAGAGNDDDTLGKQRVYVYDSSAFPFHQAELYHQFHDYRGEYQQQLLDVGRLRELDCPSEFVALLQSPMMIVFLCVVGLVACLCCCNAFISRQRSGTGMFSTQVRKFFPDSTQ